jgi:protein-tyrosine phosphatase
MAAVTLRAELERAGLAGRVRVDSAGTGDWHVGQRMDAGARAELRRRGLDGSAHRARQVSRAELATYDLIVAMDEANLASLRRLAGRDGELGGRLALLRSFDPAAGPGAEVPDPYGRRPDAYAEVFEQVAAAAKGLTAQLGRLLADRPDGPAQDQPTARDVSFERTSPRTPAATADRPAAGRNAGRSRPAFRGRRPGRGQRRG